MTGQEFVPLHHHLIPAIDTVSWRLKRIRKIEHRRLGSSISTDFVKVLETLGC